MVKIMAKMLDIHCQEPWFSKICQGYKTVEGRKFSEKYARLAPGSLLRFYCDERSFIAEVVQVISYKSLEEYLTVEGFSKVLPGITSFAAALEIYLQYNTRQELEEAGSFLGIHLKLIKQGVVNE